MAALLFHGGDLSLAAWLVLLAVAGVAFIGFWVLVAVVWGRLAMNRRAGVAARQEADLEPNRESPGGRRRA